MMDTVYLQVTTTVDDEKKAELIAETLVERKLAACVQVLGPLTAIYRWKGEIERSQEWMCLIKTTARNLSALRELLSDLHPYETPEILAIPIIAGSDSYLGWIDENTLP